MQAYRNAENSPPLRTSCPDCGRGPKDRTMGKFQCFRCGALRPRERSLPKPRQTAEVVRWVDPNPAGLPGYWRALWDTTQPLGGIATDYLKSRGCRLPPPDSDLRWHPSMRHPTGYVGPALVALIRHAVTGDPMSIHRTWISGDGTKPVQPARLLAKGCVKMHGVVMLWPSEAVTYSLGIAEGLETALALAHVHGPVWAAIDAGNLAAFPVLAGIQTLLVAVDGDPAGRNAAEACANRWCTSATVKLIQSADGEDIADVAVQP